MRQLPATSNAGATGSTENSRSRSHPSNDSAGLRILSNGSLKEPIVTRSKSRLRGSRRLSGRSPLKLSSPLKRNDGGQKRKLEKGTGTSSRHNSSSSTSRSSSSSPNNVSNSGAEKMYARHYKSYRGLNGVKSRRNYSSSNEDQHSPKITKSGPENSRRSKTNRSRSVLRNSKEGSKNGTPRNHVVHQNGISSRSPSPPKSTRTPSSRIRQLVLRRKKQLTNRRLRGDISPPKSPQNDEEEKDEDTSPRERDKAGKRRSALWVLNCEAESFLFGETAAEKDEIELPPLAPLSPPPKKRRWRGTELGHLLEKTPILESKLRKSSSPESESDTQRDPSPQRKRLKPDAQRTPRRVKNNKRREKTPEMCSSKSVNGGNQEEQQVLSPKPELLSPIPFLYSPDSVDYETKTIQFRQMLSNLNWGYAFERSPDHESWWDAFSRTESSIIPYTSFFNPLQEQMVLPYEMDKPIRRSRTKPVKNSRKSPRCHASTLAILSSERPTRSTRNSVTSEASPTPTANNLPSETTLPPLLLTPTSATSSKTATTPVPPTSSPSTSKLSPPKQIPSTSRRRNPSAVSPRPIQQDTKKELGAAQYLWDSIQFLSDPYVVTLLSGDDPQAVPEPPEPNTNHKSKTGFAKNHRCTNNNYVNCPVKHLGKHLETSERKASLRSGDGSSVNNVTNSRLVSTPKSSPRNQSHHGTNNHVGGHHHNHTIASPPISPSAVNDRVPPMNGITRRFTSRSPPVSPPVRSNGVQCNAAKLANSRNSKGSTTNSTTNGKQSGKSGKGSGSDGDNGLIHHDKSTSKKSPIILVSELLHASSKVKAINNWEEKSLFAGDGLPPLPQWPV